MRVNLGGFTTYTVVEAGDRSRGFSQVLGDRDFWTSCDLPFDVLSHCECL